jgi:hypothetical protein
MPPPAPPGWAGSKPSTIRAAPFYPADRGGAALPPRTPADARRPAGGRRDASANQTRTAQLDHLAAVVTLETISFGVIPADAEMHAITRCGFILYHDALNIVRSIAHP